MKQCEKWLDKSHPHWKKFPCITSTYKEGWRAAFELMLKWLEIEEPFETFQARIKKELENGN